MNWVIDAFWARIGWVLGDVAISFGIVVGVGIAMLAVQTPRLIRQMKCKHTSFHETGACDAICNDCGKNLGFIGTLIDKRRAIQ